METKRCPHCTNLLPADAYHISRKSSDGLCSYCKQCQNAIRREKRKSKVGYYATEQSKRNRRLARKKKVIAHYSNREMCCVRCSFSDMRALSIDHIKGDGAKHRREVKAARNLYRWLIAQNYPDGFQVLCMNCQFIKRHENYEFSNGLSLEELVVPGSPP